MVEQLQQMPLSFPFQFTTIHSLKMSNLILFLVCLFPSSFIASNLSHHHQSATMSSTAFNHRSGSITKILQWAISLLCRIGQYQNGLLLHDTEQSTTKFHINRIRWHWGGTTSHGLKYYGQFFNGQHTGSKSISLVQKYKQCPKIDNNRAIHTAKCPKSTGSLARHQITRHFTSSQFDKSPNGATLWEYPIEWAIDTVAIFGCTSSGKCAQGLVGQVICGAVWFNGEWVRENGIRFRYDFTV